MGTAHRPISGNNQRLFPKPFNPPQRNIDIYKHMTRVFTPQGAKPFRLTLNWGPRDKQAYRGI